MALKERIRGLRRSVRQLPGRTPLRVKLIAAMLVLVAAALAVISFAGIAFLRGYLLNQADQRLRTAAYNAPIQQIVYSYLFLGNGPAQPAYGQLSIEWLPQHGRLQQVLAEYSGFRSDQPQLIPGPAVRLSDGWLYQPGPASRRAYNWLGTVGAPVSAPVTVGASSGDVRWRVVSSPATIRSPSGRVLNGSIILGLDVTSIYRTLNELTVIDVLVSGALLVVLAALGIVVIRSSMRPLSDIERTAQAIAAGDLGRRVPERDPRTEVGKLGRSLNTMLAQIEAAFVARTASEEAARRSEDAARRSAYAASRSEERVRQFVADASHELRTPLTAIRGYAEYYRQRGGVADASALSRADLDKLIERVEAEARRMGVLVDDMLLLARLDQQRQLDSRTVDLLAIAADALHDARVIAPDRAINLTVGTSDAPLVTGDEVGLRQVVANLMSNAMMHTPEGTPIEITIRSGTMSEGHAPAAVCA